MDLLNCDRERSKRERKNETRKVHHVNCAVHTLLFDHHHFFSDFCVLLVYLMDSLGLPVVLVFPLFNTIKLLSTRLRIIACMYDRQQCK